MTTKKPKGPPPDIAAIRYGVRSFLKQQAEDGGTIGGCQCGAYAFYDYDGEPIYVGRTYEGLSDRITRHLTNQRSDAVAMSVLDPLEVAEIEVWPLIELRLLQDKPSPAERDLLNRLESAVYEKAVRASRFQAVLNEKPPRKQQEIQLPRSYRNFIVPPDVRARLEHPDTRIARRALTIANLAKVINERRPSRGLRKTLVTQAKRLLSLAERRCDSFGGKA